MRTIISIDDDIKNWIDIKSAADRISMAEIVRRALRQYRQTEEKSIDAVLNQTSGIWPAEDGLDYQTRLRDEWGQ